MWTERDFFWFVAVVFLFGLAAGAALFIGLPWLWSLVKPMLHALTA